MRAAARLAGKPIPAATRHGRSTELAKFGLLVANPSGRRAREAQHGTLNPPVPSAGGPGARSCARDGGGDSGHRESAGGRCPASGVTHRPKHQVQRERKVGVGLT